MKTAKKTAATVPAASKPAVAKAAPKVESKPAPKEKAGPEPTGHCWCGCGLETKGGFFSPGHDMKALKAAMKSAGYESVAHFIAAHNLVPPAPVKEAPKAAPSKPAKKAA